MFLLVITSRIMYMMPCCSLLLCGGSFASRTSGILILRSFGWHMCDCECFINLALSEQHIVWLLKWEILIISCSWRRWFLEMKPFCFLFAFVVFTILVCTNDWTTRNKTVSLYKWLNTIKVGTFECLFDKIIQ